MTIKKCRVTSNRKNFWDNPKIGGNNYTYEYNNSNIPPGQDKYLRERKLCASRRVQPGGNRI